MLKLLKFRILLVLLILIPYNVLAQTSEEFIKTVTQQASSILMQNISKEQKSQELIELAKTNVDIRAIGLYTLGKHKKNISEDQLKEFEELFYQYFLKTFSSRLSEYSDPKINVISQKIINEKNDYQYALPGDLVKIDEDLLTGAKRILKSLTSLDNIYLKQFYTFGNPDRTKEKKDQSWLRLYRKKPEERVVTVGYIALVNMEEYVPQASSFAFEAEWVEVNKLSQDLAFDHNHILSFYLIFRC